MPLYDYRCTECGEVIEVMHGIDGTGPSACQACGGPMRKALSSPAIHFKGSGWAKKDAAASAKKAKPKPTTSPSAKSGSSEKGGESSGSGSGESVKSGAKSSSNGETSGATTSAKSD